MTKDFNIILNDAEVEVVAEVVGGTTFAYDYTKKLLEHGKSVVTSNKALVAEKGAELLKIAREHNCNYLFEASVGGGIPIIRPLNKCLAGNEILQISGILNGTTNFILTKMIKEQMSLTMLLKWLRSLVTLRLTLRLTLRARTLAERSVYLAHLHTASTFILKWYTAQA